MLINDWTVFWFHDFGINRCRVVVMTHQNILLESTGQWLVLNVINLSQFGRKVRFPLRKETYSTLSILFYQFYANLELSERIKGLLKFITRKIADLLSLLYQLRYYIIIFLTVCIYPLTRNSREGKYQNCFNCYFRTWEYIKYIIYLNAEKDSIDHRSYACKVRSCEIKAWKKFMLKWGSNRQPPLRCRCSALSSKMCYEASWELVTFWCFTLKKMLLLYRRSLPRWCSLF